MPVLPAGKMEKVCIHTHYLSQRMNKIITVPNVFSDTDAESTIVSPVTAEWGSTGGTQQRRQGTMVRSKVWAGSQQLCSFSHFAPSDQEVGTRSITPQTNAATSHKSDHSKQDVEISHKSDHSKQDVDQTVGIRLKIEANCFSFWEHF